MRLFKEESAAEAEAGALIGRLSRRGIELRLEGQALRWATRGEAALTLADRRAIKRLDPEVRAFLFHWEAANAALDAQIRERDPDFRGRS